MTLVDVLALDHKMGLSKGHRVERAKKRRGKKERNDYSAPALGGNWRVCKYQRDRPGTALREGNNSEAK